MSIPEDKTIPEICADLMSKREKATQGPLRCVSIPIEIKESDADYISAAANAVPLLMEEIRRLQALLAKVQHHDCESIRCRHCGFHRELHWGVRKCLGGKTEFTPKDCTCYLSEKETT